MSTAVARVAATDGETSIWEVRRDDEVVATVQVGVRRERPVVVGVESAVDDASVALGAVLQQLRRQGAASVVVDVDAGDETTAAAIVGHRAELATTQMLLDLAQPVPEPVRVRLRPMTDAE